MLDPEHLGNLAGTIPRDAKNIEHPPKSTLCAPENIEFRVPRNIERGWAAGVGREGDLRGGNTARASLALNQIIKYYANHSLLGINKYKDRNRFAVFPTIP